MTESTFKEEPIERLIARVGYDFKNPALLEEALTHPSLTGGKSHKKGQASPYERLEFLGDRVLGLVIAEWLYTLFPLAKEGELAKRHAAMVNRDPCRDVALQIGLEHHLRLAHGEDAASPEHKNLAALSDATEAMIGALFLDGGLKAANAFIRAQWKDMITQESAAVADPKSALQEWAQGRGYPLPLYRVVESSGPAHAPHFKIEVVVKGQEPVYAEGSSKREAEKLVAQMLLEKLK